MERSHRNEMMSGKQARLSILWFSRAFVLIGLLLDSCGVCAEEIGGIPTAEWLSRGLSWVGPSEPVDKEALGWRVPARNHAKELAEMALSCLSPEGRSFSSNLVSGEGANKRNRIAAFGVMHLIEGRIPSAVTNELVALLKRRDWNSSSDRRLLANALYFARIEECHEVYEMAISDFGSKDQTRMREAIDLLFAISMCDRRAFDQLVTILIQSSRDSALYRPALGSVGVLVSRSLKLRSRLREAAKSLPIGRRRSEVEELFEVGLWR